MRMKKYSKINCFTQFLLFYSIQCLLPFMCYKQQQKQKYTKNERNFSFQSLIFINVIYITNSFLALNLIEGNVWNINYE